MKISVITICLNSENTIQFTLNSVLTQTHLHTEHVIVDGGSNDNTLKYLKEYKHKNKKIIIAKGKSLYESLNIGIKASSGQLVTILHSDDIFNNTNVLSKMADTAKKNKEKIFFGNVVYFRKKNFEKIVRNYTGVEFKKKNFLIGDMPPHTGSFYKKEIFKQYGYYDKNFKIAGDFDHLLRLIFIKNIQFKTVNYTISRMKVGGLSSKNWKSFVIINREIIKSLKKNKIQTSIFKILTRVPKKIKQYFFLNQKELNSKFSLKIDNFYKYKLFKTINIIDNTKKINFKKNFILSALNLAFLGSLAKNEIQLNKHIINWPDGIFSKFYNRNFKKIPGREILNKLKIPNSIKRLVVLGQLSNNGKKFIEHKFKKKIVHKTLPFGTFGKISKKLNFKIKRSDLLFLTLPTPKQEQIANYLVKKNKYFKIICIGGSIAIVSGDEKPVPNFMINFEFLWRLRYETRRRLFRLFSTFYSYVFDIFISRKLKDIKIRTIK